MVEIIDPRKALKAAREARGEPSAAEVIMPRLRKGRPSGAPQDNQVDRLKEDFRVFLSLIWRYLLKQDPSPLQLDFAWWLQHRPQQRIGIMAFRGAAKSWVTGAYALWVLYCDPDKKVLIVSGSAKRAVASTNWCLQLIMEIPELAHLRPGRNQRSSSAGFDVGPARPDQSPSFNSSGITGQIVGFRGDEIIADDVETQTNSLTVTMREKTIDAVKEFDSILKPGGNLTFLGTPHDSDSLYNHLPAVLFRVWPGRYPSADQAKAYLYFPEGRPAEDRLAPFIKAKISKDPALIGHTTEPLRFTDADLAKREYSMGRSEFTLQFLLDVTLTDRDKYPLKLRDLIVMDLDRDKGPESLVWGPTNAHTDLPLMGFTGDRFYRPLFIGDYFAKWNVVSAFIDPSGRGADETGLTIVAELHGYIFVLCIMGFQDGSAPETLLEIAKALVAYRVNTVEIEDNFGDGMFAQLLRPVLTATWKQAEILAKSSGQNTKDRSWGSTVEDVHSSNQMNKEKRILSILEPITQQHRLVVSREVIEADLRSIEKKEAEDTARSYSTFYQYTRLTPQRDSLKHDDRLESLAGACRRYAAALGVDPGQMAQRAANERQETDLARMLEGRLLSGEGAPTDPQGRRARAAQRSTR